MSEVINFSQVPTAINNEYLEPGMYRLKIDIAGTKVVTPDGKTPYLNVRFVSEKYGSVSEKFFLTAKALPRLQYLHEGWFNKKLDKVFQSFKEVGEYFQKALSIKPEVSRPMITGGKIAANGKFYSGLPFTGFIVADESLFEEGAFEKDSMRYKNAVTIDKPNSAVANTNAAILPDGGDLPDGGYAPVDDGSNPW